jgi:cytochrome c oxidase cbb3-type subunit 3
MRRRALLSVLTAVAAGCGSRGAPPGRPAPDSQVIRPSQVLDFGVLYGGNCAGCHGPEGKGGAAIGLGDPVYLAIADDAVIRRVTAGGVAGTAMPAFAQSAGGMLTDAQVDALVTGMRARWGKPNLLQGQAPPPYSPPGPGDARRGASVYATACASCHGPAGRGSQRASSIVDGTYLALVSDQHLRTTVIVGRPELGAPDWRGDVPGKPLSPEDVSDVVAWLAGQRPPFPGGRP